MEAVTRSCHVRSLLIQVNKETHDQKKTSAGFSARDRRVALCDKRASNKSNFLIWVLHRVSKSNIYLPYGHNPPITSNGAALPCSIISLWTDCLSTGSGAWSAAVLREQHMHTCRGPVQPRLAQYSLRASAVRQAVKEACWGTDCHPPLSLWEAHCGHRSSQDLGNSVLPVCVVVYLKWSTALPLRTTSCGEMTPPPPTPTCKLLQ